MTPANAATRAAPATPAATPAATTARLPGTPRVTAKHDSNDEASFDNLTKNDDQSA